MGMPAASDLLRKVDLFKDLKPEDLQAMASLLQRRGFPKGNVVFFKGDPGDALYLIASGGVHVVLYGRDGKEVILDHMGEGAFFGEMALLDSEPRSATVVTTEHSECWVLGRDDFLRHMEQSPRACAAILTELCRRLRHADEQIESLALLDVQGRLARILLKLAEQRGKPVDGGVVVERCPTQSEMAAMAGISRETVSRILRFYQGRGLLRLKSSILFLHERMFKRKHSR